jgi:hypothetical protein
MKILLDQIKILDSDNPVNGTIYKKLDSNLKMTEAYVMPSKLFR